MGDEKRAVAPWDIPWTFTVEWNPASGKLPWQILRLFRYRSTIEPGRADLATDRGHATHYERSVRAFVQKYYPERPDITAAASETAP